MAWVKFHDDALADPKLMRAARAGLRELELLPWLLVFARKAGDHGRLSVHGTAAEPDEIAHYLPGISAERVAGAIASLFAISVLVEDPDHVYRFDKWEERQAKPSSSRSAMAERKRRERQRKKEERQRAAAGAEEGSGSELGVPSPGGVPSPKSPDSDQAREGSPEGSSVPSDEASTPTIDRRHAPSRVTVTPCHAPEQKRTEEKRVAAAAASGVTGAGHAAVSRSAPQPPEVRGIGYLVRCVVALNRGMTANAHVAAREVPSNTQLGKVTWEEDGIPLEVAERVIADRCATFRPTPTRRQINALSYFDGAVREAWGEIRAVQASAGASPTDPSTWVPGALSPQDDAWARAHGY